MNSIPVLDLRDFTQGDPSRKLKFVNSLGESFRETGFVVIEGHDFEENLRTELYEQVKSFFSLPAEVKEKYNVEGLGGQRGYTPFGREHAKDSNAPDLKEFWQFGQKANKENDGHPAFPKNISVEELPMFNPLGMKSFKVLEKIGTDLMRAIALHLKCDEDFFTSHVSGGNSILRAIHYPPLKQNPGDALRSAEHEDINLITLLMGASSKGLEVKMRDGSWLALQAEPGQLIVNVGDMLQRLTNNVLPSTTHRVTNPEREDWTNPRYSLPFFLHPKPEMPLNCLTQCVEESGEKVYDDILAGDYLIQRLKEIGLIK